MIQEEKQEISVEKAIQDLHNLFELDKKESKSIRDDKTFMIIKTEFNRFEVIKKLLDYFKDKMLPVGWGCEIESITLLWTTFELKQL